MSSPVFTVDGVRYNVMVHTDGIKRTAAVLDGENTARTKSGVMVRDIIGTYYNYTIDLDTSGLDVASYDSLYEVLTAPEDYHIIEVPYGQGTIRFKAYVSNAADTLSSMDDGVNRWKGLSINFIAMEPYRQG